MDFTISSLRGGMNNTDPPLSLADDQCTSALNVEWVDSMLGERRRGSEAIGLGSGVTLANVAFLFRHLPSTDESDSELWAYGTGFGSTSLLRRKTIQWTTVAPADPIDTDYKYDIAAVTLHGKMFLAYKSSADRLHVYDGTSLRRAGVAAAATYPTVLDGAVAGTMSGRRYYRVRFVELSGSTVVRRSEPSASYAWDPDTTHDSVIITRPTAVNEGESHWETEASLDDVTFYRISTTAIATTTSTDSTLYSDGYSSNTLSETSGDYSLIPSGRFLLAVDDRLMVLGSFEDDELAARVTWTPVFKATGVGNDERIPVETVSFRDLDTFEGGPITGAVGPVEGEIWVFKRSHIYKLIRTGNRGANAYDVITVSKKRGAIKGSMVEGVDQQGRPCVYFLDPKVGPCRIGANGIQRCGRDIFTTWKTVNLNAAFVQSRVVFYDTPSQVHWWIPTGGSDVPDTRIVLHVEESRDQADGVRRGWATWTGPSAAALSVILYANNVDSASEDPPFNAPPRSLTLQPLIGTATGIWLTDTGDDDNGTEYASSLATKPYAPATVINQFGVRSAALVAAPQAGATIDLTAIADFGKDSTAVKEVEGITLDPVASETQVIKMLDNFSLEEMRSVSFTFADPATPGARWELNQLVLSDTPGQTS